MAWLLNLSKGAKNMSTCLVRSIIYCGFNRSPRDILVTKCLVDSSHWQGKKFHNSSVMTNIDSTFKRLDQLMNQGRKSIMKLKSKDKVPQDHVLIYKASMELTMRVGYTTFVSLALGFIGAIFYKSSYDDKFINPKSIGRDGGLKFHYPKEELLLMCTAMILMIISASSIMLKYPFRIYKNNKKKEYIALYVNPLLPTLRQVQFKSATPTKFKNPIFSFLQLDCQFLLDGKKKTLLMDQFFRVPKDLTDMYEVPKVMR